MEPMDSVFRLHCDHAFKIRGNVGGQPGSDDDRLRGGHHSDDKEESDQADDEWGATATQDRSYTLLPILRKFIGIVMAVMVTLIVLSSMGINIGPLLAGAGVAGPAIGFGA